MERNSTHMEIRPRGLGMESAVGNAFSQSGPNLNNATTRPPVNFPLQYNSSEEFQMRMNLGPNPAQILPTNQQMFQQRPPNYQQQGPRFLQNGNQIRFSNNLNVRSTNEMTEGSFSVANTERVDFQRRPTSMPPNQQMHFANQKPRFPNSVPVMQPFTTEMRNLSNQSLQKSRMPDSIQQIDYVQNQSINSNIGKSMMALYPGKNNYTGISQTNNMKKETDLEWKNNSEPRAKVLESEMKEELEIFNTRKTPQVKNNTRNCLKIFENFRRSPATLDELFTPGTVLKNIKFFEENDTAKTPLTPKQFSMEKPENDDDKKACRKQQQQQHSGDGESGVDESPLYHPNLRSISDTPLNMAKIPLHRYKKKAKNKNAPISNSTFKSFHSHEPKQSWKNDNLLPKKKVRWSSSSVESSKHFRPNRAYIMRQSQVDTNKPDDEISHFFLKPDSMRLAQRFGETKGNQEAGSGSGGKPTTNGDIRSPQKSRSKLPGPSQKAPLSLPTESPMKSPGTPKAKSLPKTPENPTPPTPTNKKVPMNKIQVGAAPSPNLRAAKSKVGSLINTTHKPGGGNVRIESHKIDFSKTQSRIEAKNDQYVRSGGDKKIPQVKLQWEAKSKVGSLENTTYKPGGGDKKIESIKLDFKERAKSKVGSKDNVKYVPGGGMVKIESQKLEFKAHSKVGSLDNVKHKPGGGDVKIFDDKTYLRQISGSNSEGGVSGTQNFGYYHWGKGAERRSVPGTPGSKTIVKISRTTIVSSDEPAVKNAKKFPNFPNAMINCKKKPQTERLIKVTYSTAEDKESSLTRLNNVIKMPKKEKAPTLRVNLSGSDADDDGENERMINSRFVGKSIDFANLNSNREMIDFANTDYNRDEEATHLKSHTYALSRFAPEQMTKEKEWMEKNNPSNPQTKVEYLKSYQPIAFAKFSSSPQFNLPPQN